MSLSKSKCWYSNNCLHFLKHAVPLTQENSKLTALLLSATLNKIDSMCTLLQEKAKCTALIVSANLQL